jgi:hypothetical protein
MKSDLPKIPLVVSYQGRNYIAVDGLVAAVKDKGVMANVALMLKIGAEKESTLAATLERALAGFVLQVSGDCKGVEFSPVEMAAMQSMLDKNFKAGGIAP